MQQGLGVVIDCKEESRLGVITALWNYIKINNLQDKVDRRLIRLDDKLKHVGSFNATERRLLIYPIYHADF